MQKTTVLIVVTGLSVLGGCASDQSKTRITSLERQLSQKRSHIQKLESDLESRDTSLADYQRIALANTASQQAPLPPNPKAGECYARVFVPPTHKNITEKVMSSEASEQVEVIPAEYKMVQQRVLVKEASKRLEEIPAEYKWVEERVLVEEGFTRYEPVEAQYKEEEERVMVTAAHTEWKKGRGPVERVDDTTGEIMCLVEVPAVYKTVRKRVLTKPASVREVKVPARYETVRKQVISKPATVKEIAIPAEYKTVEVRKLVRPSQTKRRQIPAEYETLTKTVKQTEGYMEWRRVLCETNSTPAIIRQIENALKTAGQNPGKIDGILDDDAYAAIRSYQESKNLSVGGLTHQTIESLGIKMN